MEVTVRSEDMRVDDDIMNGEDDLDDYWICK